MTTPTKELNASPKASTRVRMTKKDQLIKLLATKSGANLEKLSSKLGWQHHTTRAAISGLRKAGYDVANEASANGGPSKYRILSGPAVETAQTAAGQAHGA